jgi:hypothetical protein
MLEKNNPNIMSKSPQFQHQSLAQGRWAKLSFAQQMAHVGSEVFRTIKWKEKGNDEYSQKAGFRALELLSLTLRHAERYPKLKEVARVKEVFADYFYGDNQYHSTAEQWRKYFYAFTYAARAQR